MKVIMLENTHIVQSQILPYAKTTIEDIIQQMLYFTGSETEKEAKKAGGKTKPDPWVCAFNWLQLDVSPRWMWGPGSPGAGDSKEACDLRRGACKYEFKIFLIFYILFPSSEQPNPFNGLTCRGSIR